MKKIKALSEFGTTDMKIIKINLLMGILLAPERLQEQVLSKYAQYLIFSHWVTRCRVQRTNK